VVDGSPKGQNRLLGREEDRFPTPSAVKRGKKRGGPTSVSNEFRPDRPNAAASPAARFGGDVPGKKHSGAQNVREEGKSQGGSMNESSKEDSYARLLGDGDNRRRPKGQEGGSGDCPLQGGHSSTKKQQVEGKFLKIKERDAPK